MEFITKILTNNFLTVVLVSQITAILSAGILGGVINYYLENETKISDKENRIYQIKRHVSLGIGASFLVPLFLWITQSEIRNNIEKSVSSFLVFIGFCLVAAISAEKFIKTLSNRILKEVKEIKKENEEFKENLEKQEVKDARTLALVEKQLNEGKFSDEDNIEITKDEFKEMISSASRSTRIIVFEKARTFRIENYEDNKTKKKLINAIPVFEALIAGDKENKFHRNHGQLAYILKDKEPAEFENAIKQINQAIEKRDKNKIPAFRLYEFNRAICRIKLDVKYKKENSDQKIDKELILSDLKKAAKNEYWRNAIINSAKDKRSVCISEWLKDNGLTEKDFKSV
jgi:uncharacterized membrane protein (DUF106 family)